jgi:archaetidylinositol phosphate synthase
MIVRVNQAWSAPLERHLLLWLAARMPSWVTPDHLTILGVSGALLCGLAYCATWLSPYFLWLSAFGLIVNWFGDSLDGNLARFRKIERPRYGFFIDHTTDVISQVFVFFGLGASPYMHFDTACLAVISYWLASLYTFIRAVATQVFQISYFGIGPTEIRIGLLLYSVLLGLVGSIAVPTPWGAPTVIDIIVSAIFVVVFISFLAQVWIEGRRLAAEDLPPG